MGWLSTSRIRNSRPEVPAQKTILKRSRKSGSVSKPDYELAWSNYKQCVTSYGYTTPVLRQFSNGLYMIAMRDTTGMSDQQRKKFNEDENKCYNTEVIAVTGVYQMQIGNPGMLSDGDQAMVDCLHKAGIVPKNYDKEAYKKDLDAHAKNQPTTVDFSNAEMQSCWVANGASFGDVNDTDLESCGTETFMRVGWHRTCVPAPRTDAAWW